MPTTPETFQAHGERTNWYAAFDPLLSSRDAEDIVDLCRRHGGYKMYSEEPTFEGIGKGYPARYDAARNFVKTGGRFSRREEIRTLAARTNYFRETYAYGDRVVAPGIEPYLGHRGFVEAAKQLFGGTVVVPAIVYANLLVPGQELAIHTDVPEFRGMNRMKDPQWLMVAMHHSRLFEDYRIRIATGVAWYHDCEGGEFAFYPDGAGGAPEAHPVSFNTALLMDTDSVFHGVDRVRETGEAVDLLGPGMRLVHDEGDDWSVRDGERTVTRYRWPELRFSVSWKAYVFADDDERRRQETHSHDLDRAGVVDRLVEDLRERGIVAGARPSDDDLVETIIDTYIRFPRPAGEGTAAA